ncbi:MAG: hypothetical protein ABSG68_10460 [Thermoguttaceae bacterium]|jgi:hypothetical protein
MPRPAQPEIEAVNADSFLDIVASVVSIMIIMVLVTGLKIKNMPVEALLRGESAELHSELSKELASEQSVRGDVLKTVAQIENIKREILARGQERDELAFAVAGLEQKLGADRQQIDAGAQGEAELTRGLAEARAGLDQIERQRSTVATGALPPIAVESYPTPISRTVDGHEIHFQLRGNRVAYVPMDELTQLVKNDFRRKAAEMGKRTEMTETIGPEEGFRLRYTIERDDIAAEVDGKHAYAGGSRISLTHFTLVPVADNLGEPIAEALAQGSRLRQLLSRRSPAGVTITLWTYPDSFDAFRRLKKELYRMDYAVAGRPLPEGQPIGGSPHGSKSAAE